MGRADGRLRWAVVTAGVFGLLLSACTSDGAARIEPSTTATSTSGPAATCPSSSGANPSVDRLVVDGTERRFLVHDPLAAERGPVPLVIAFHGFGGSAEQLDERTGLGERGAATGALVVFPEALGSPARWNFDRRPDGPDDHGFIDALIEHLVEGSCVDAARITVVGASNGAAFAGVLACQNPGRFAVVAMVIATVPVSCGDGPVPAVLTVRGTADQRVPYAGTVELVDADAARGGCRSEPVTTRLEPDATRSAHVGCRGGAEIVLDTVHGGTHRWPVADDDAGYDATDRILAFIRRHLPAS